METSLLHRFSTPRGSPLANRPSTPAPLRLSPLLFSATQEAPNNDEDPSSESSIVSQDMPTTQEMAERLAQLRRCTASAEDKLAAEINDLKSVVAAIRLQQQLDQAEIRRQNEEIEGLRREMSLLRSTI